MSVESAVERVTSSVEMRAVRLEVEPETEPERLLIESWSVLSAVDRVTSSVEMRAVRLEVEPETEPERLLIESWSVLSAVERATSSVDILDVSEVSAEALTDSSTEILESRDTIDEASIAPLISASSDPT